MKPLSPKEREIRFSPEYLRKCFNYDKATGELRWKSRPLDHFKSDRYFRAWNHTHAGRIAGKRTKSGTMHLTIMKDKFLGHRVAWAIVTGEWPSELIDHIDGDPGNNAFSNLRQATFQQNQFNRRANRSSSTGVKGVSIVRRSGKFKAAISFNRKTINLGHFDTVDLASKAYQEAARKLHDEFFHAGDAT